MTRGQDPRSRYWIERGEFDKNMHGSELLHSISGITAAAAAAGRQQVHRCPKIGVEHIELAPSIPPRRSTAFTTGALSLAGGPLAPVGPGIAVAVSISACRSASAWRVSAVSSSRKVK